MPALDGKGPVSGNSGRGFGIGAEGSCRCPECGLVQHHTTGKPCSAISCPDCGAKLVKEATAILKKVADVAEYFRQYRVSRDPQRRNAELFKTAFYNSFEYLAGRQPSDAEVDAFVKSSQFIDDAAFRSMTRKAPKLPTVAEIQAKLSDPNTDPKQIPILKDFLQRIQNKPSGFQTQIGGEYDIEDIRTQQDKRNPFIHDHPDDQALAGGMGGLPGGVTTLGRGTMMGLRGLFGSRNSAKRYRAELTARNRADRRKQWLDNLALTDPDAHAKELRRQQLEQFKKERADNRVFSTALSGEYQEDMKSLLANIKAEEAVRNPPRVQPAPAVQPKPPIVPPKKQVTPEPKPAVPAVNVPGDTEGKRLLADRSNRTTEAVV
jgi:hypothetical protein